MLTSFYLHDRKVQMLDRLHTGSAMTTAPSLCGSLDSTLLSCVVWFCPYFGGEQWYLGLFYVPSVKR